MAGPWCGAGLGRSAEHRTAFERTLAAQILPAGPSCCLQTELLVLLLNPTIVQRFARRWGDSVSVGMCFGPQHSASFLPRAANPGPLPTCVLRGKGSCTAPLLLLHPYNWYFTPIFIIEPLFLLLHPIINIIAPLLLLLHPYYYCTPILLPYYCTCSKPAAVTCKASAERF